MAKECRRLLEAGKGRKWVLLSRAQKGIQRADTLILA
jgi:hypothetical protein